MSTPTAQKVQALADRFGVVYRPTPLDAWAETVTELSGDSIEPDPTADLLVALVRAGHLTSLDLVRLLSQHLHEASEPTP